MPDGAPCVTSDQPQTAERLRVGGLTPLTTLDYPGELAAVIFCQGCPWRCRYCQNGTLLDATAVASLIDWADIRTFLQRRVGLLDAVVFSGGEPTAQAALAAAMRETRAFGYKIGLHTSGAYPERLSSLLPLLDWVGLDIKALPEDYPALTGVPDSGERAWSSLALLVDSGVSLEVRTTLMPGWTPDYLQALSRKLAAIGVRHYVVQTCVTQRALDPLLPGYSISPQELAAGIEPRWFERFERRGI